MAIEAKATLLSNLEKQLSTSITVADMSKVLSALSDQLNYYEVTQTNPQDNGVDDLMDAYLTAKRIEGRSEKTIARYSYIIHRMMKTLNISTRSITVYHLRKYLADEKVRGISDRTLEGIRQVLHTYFNWLHRERLIDFCPVANLGAIKYQKKIKLIYSDVDIEKLKICCKTKRDRAIVMFLLSTGCRISEMVQLNRDDVDLNSLECAVLGKGGKERTVYLSSVAATYLKEYLEQRADISSALFVGRNSNRLKQSSVREMLKRLENNTGVNHVHPHKFRRTLATNLIKHGMPIQEVAAILGHDKIDTTMQYVVLDQTGVKNSYRRYA